jgi:uncharacterized repeat protein (TIGR01451 family)
MSMLRRRSIAVLVVPSLLFAAGLAVAQTSSRTAPAGSEPAPQPNSQFLPNAVITEAFDTVPGSPNGCPTGWNCQNRSTTVGSTGWFQGNPAVFPAQAGATNAYIGANFNNTTGADTISNWLISPQVNFGTGATLTFFTRQVTGNPFPDRLEVRLSTAGASTNVGTTDASVGDFTTLLVSVNPNLTAGDGACPYVSPGTYPAAWCQITLTATNGIPTSGSGRVAFRYFVTSGGPAGANSNYIGIDTFSFDEGVQATDLALSQSNDAVQPLQLNNTFNKTLTVTNNGPSAATNITVVDTLPAQLQHVSNNCGAAVVGQQVTWTIASLAVSASASCVINVRVVATGNITNTAAITGSTPPDNTPANNTSTVVITGASAAATSVPALGTVGLALLVLSLGLIAFLAVRRRQAF